MRIVIATTSGFHVRHLARELITLGRDITYLTYQPKYRILRDAIPLNRARSYFLRLQPWSAAALFRYFPAVQNRAVEKMFALADAAYARDLPPCDVFIGMSAMAVESAREARRKYGAKVILERGSQHVLSQNRLLVEAGGRALSQSWVERELAGYDVADYIALPSTHAVQSFLDHGFAAGRLFKNPYGVDLTVFRPSPRPNGPVRLLYIGGWTLQKGCDAIARVLQISPELQLTHIGTKGDLDFPKLPNFVSLGHKAHRDMREVMSSHHILVLPSRQDGFGMVLVEALASGLPVIGSVNTGAPDLKELIANESAVRVIRPANSEDLIIAIQQLSAWLRDQTPCRELLTDADKKNLSWAAYARRYDTFVQSIG